MTEAVRCGRCHVRYDGRREKCPRCGAREPIAIVAPRQRSRVRGGDPRRLAIAAAIALVSIGAPAGWLWVTSGASASTTKAAQPSTPVPLVRFLKGDDTSSLKLGWRVPTIVPFVDAPAAGRREYEGGDYDAALEHFKAQIGFQPAHAEPYSNAGQVLVRLGRTSEAVPLLQKAVELDPARWAYRFNLARAEGLMGQWDKAAQDYAEASKLFPGDYATLFNLAQSLHRAGREEEAVARYREAIGQKPEDSSFYLALAASEDKLGHGAEAATAYRHYLSMEPSARHAEAIAARATQLEGASAASKPSAGGEQPPQ